MLKALLMGGVVLVAGCEVKKTAVAQGAWTGLIGEGHPKPIGVRFILEDDNNGHLSGEMGFQDPVTKEFANDGTLTGTRDGNTATWTSETDVVIKGTFEDSKFTGTIDFPPDEGHPHPPVLLTLTR